MEMETNSDELCVGKSYGNHTHATCKEDIESAERQDGRDAKMIQKNVSDMVYYHRKLLNNDPNTPCDPENLEST
uniref:Uncharacterized protein n=1 Tax=Ditylenchus dipsaci TaxID=166011 RepID=A0A915ELN0_9BILA